MMIIVIIVLVAIVIWLLIIKYERVKCPECGGRMKMTSYTDTTNIWTCTECGCKITVEDYDE